MNKPVEVITFDCPVKFSFMGIAYPFGGAKEIFGLRGISHLMEHMMCKTFYRDMAERLNALDIIWNASTSDGRVVFWFRGLTECLEEVSQELFERIVLQTHPLWTEEEFENEKKTVLQEYKDVFNKQFSGFYLNQLRKYYNYYAAIGDYSDIESFTYAQSLQAAELFKRPLKISLVNLSLKDLDTVSGCSEIPTSVVYSPEGYKYSMEHVPKLDKTAVLVLGQPITQNLQAYDLMTTCLTGGFTTPFFDAIRETRGLSYSVSAPATVINDSYMIPGFTATTSNERAEELAEVFEELLNTPLNELVTEANFNAFRKSTDISKKTLERLPHQGMGPHSLSEFDPFINLPNSYSEFLEMCSPLYTRKNFTIISY